MFKSPKREIQCKNSEDLLVWRAFKDEDDKEAFELIYQSNVRHLYNYGMKIFHDTDVVEDCIQELFINIWDQRKNLIETNNIQFYLIKALRWKIIRFVDAHNKKLKNISESFSHTELEVVHPYEELLVNEQIDLEKKEKLRAALNSLPNRQKEVIHLIFYKKYSYEEASQIMSMNLRSVYTLAWKAISNLRKVILLFIPVSLF